MPKRTDIKSILIIGAGPIIIGQACEFDYSGTQACKALRDEGYRVILVNSNPATIMTDPELADATYIEPVTPEIVAKIIEKERPDALLPTMGGQTALNCALSLRRMGVLEKYGVEMIGADADAIDMAEDRKLFREAMIRIGLNVPRSKLANASDLKANDKAEHAAALAKIDGPKASEEDKRTRREAFEAEWRKGESGRKELYREKAFTEALDALTDIGLPVIIRPSFTLGGTGGGIAYNRAEFIEIIDRGLDASPTTEVLIEESVLGWKEYEMEVVRDRDDNCIIICSIENIDPMGVHTGDSITVAPALTLTDKEFQEMRNASIAVLREIGVETGGSNVQFAVNPKDGALVVIEMNPRVSRSSALASKATGFPIAKVAARLSVGYTLDELANDITGGATPASFEPSIDYVVTKIPRFAFEKFPGAVPNLTTSMKSVGEVMAIGRTFKESFQKALRGLEIGLTGINEVDIPGVGQGDDKNVIRAALSNATPERILTAVQALRHGIDHDQINASCHIDLWYIRELQELVDTEADIRRLGLPTTETSFRRLKAMGFSDARLGELTGQSEAEVTAKRRILDVRPAYKRVDTSAAEFASPTAYMYSTYETPFAGKISDEALPSDRKKVMILGGGPNRIGQGIEFDYCCCHAAFALEKIGIESIMVNCNPETVSTDYDTSDRLYFEPLTAEDVIEIIQREQQNGEFLGAIVQFGGQTPLKLANALQDAGIPILGTSPDALDLAEDRDRFKALVDGLKLKQPHNAIANSLSEARDAVIEINFPLVVRPSYVLGGRAMEIILDETMMSRYFANILPELVPPEIRQKFPDDKTAQIDAVLVDNPLLLDSYLTDAIEVDVDAMCDGEDVFICGVMEHIEEAGVHSGDSACVLPPHSLKPEIITEMESQTEALARALGVNGLMNVQFAVKDNEIFLIEVNPRASRTVPFVAKVIGTPIAQIAARLMCGEKLSDFGLEKWQGNHVAVKEAVFPFNRFPGVDTILGPEMRSTGEVMGLANDYSLAFAKSQLGAGVGVPTGGTAFVSVKDEDKERIANSVKNLVEMGFTVIASGGTQRFLADKGIPCTKVNKVLEGRPHVVDAIKNGEVQLVINTTKGSRALEDSQSLREAALLHKIPYYTTLSGAIAASEAINAYRKGSLDVTPVQDYTSRARQKAS